MGMLMIVWLLALRFVSRRCKKLSFMAAMGPITACVIGERRGLSCCTCDARWLVQLLCTGYRAALRCCTDSDIK
jgi:hypothetical protein